MNNRNTWRFNTGQRLVQPDAVAFLEFLRRLLMPLPGVTEKTCYGTPAFYVSKKIFCRLREDCATLVVQSLERHKWMEAEPLVFYITDHYLNTDYMLVDLKTVAPGVLSELLLTAWRNRAPKKLVLLYEEMVKQEQG